MTRTHFQHNATELDKDWGCLYPRPHHPLLTTELGGVALPSARPRRQRQEHGLSFPAAAELWLHPELRVSSSIQDPVLTARVPRNFSKVVLRLYPKWHGDRRRR